MEFRTLKAEEIKARIDQVGVYDEKTHDGYCTLLLYIDARTAMDILDETCGMGWQTKHYEVKGNLYCALGIKCENEWIWRDDCGTESYAEAEKGESSDSFKRSCVCWGLGRELYTAPNMRISCQVETNKKGKLVPVLSAFRVAEINIENKVIKSVTINAYDKNAKAWKEFFFGDIKKEEKPTTHKMTLEEAKDVTYTGKDGKQHKMGELNKSNLMLMLEYTKFPNLQQAAKVILLDLEKNENNS